MAGRESSNIYIKLSIISQPVDSLIGPLGLGGGCVVQ